MAALVVICAWNWRSYYREADCMWCVVSLLLFYLDESQTQTDEVQNGNN